MRRGARAAGFTLLEVMISLAILAGALTVLIQISASSTRASLRAAKLTMAVGLTRGKMYDLEEELLHEGFQDTAEELEGDFSDEEHPEFKWKATIEKIELPTAAQLQNALGAAGTDGEEPAEGEEAAPGGLAGLIGGGGGTMAGAGMFVQQFDLIRVVMEGALRKVTLTVTWTVGSHEEELTVACYFTDPKAVDEAVGAAAAGAGGDEPEGPGGQPTTPGGGGTGTGGRGPGGRGGGTPAGGRR